MLWYIVCETDSGYNTGYRSIFDKPSNIVYRSINRNDSLLVNNSFNSDVARLKRFSQGYYTIAKWHDTLVFQNLRFGEINGWLDKDPKFAFYYFLQYPEANNMVIQRGRVAGWDKEMMGRFVGRVFGDSGFYLGGSK